MSEDRFGFDDYARKWVPATPAWLPPEERPVWREAASQEERRRAYLAAMERTGGDGVVFRDELRERARRDAAAGLPIFEFLDGLLQDPEAGTPAALAILCQRVFGVPASRAGFIASWQPSNRSPEARRTLERVLLCVEDARRAGLWEPPPGE